MQQPRQLHPRHRFQQHRAQQPQRPPLQLLLLLHPSSHLFPFPHPPSSPPHPYYQLPASRIIRPTPYTLKLLHSSTSSPLPLRPLCSLCVKLFFALLFSASSLFFPL